MANDLDGPLKRNWFYILLALADEDRHGSAVMREVLDLTDGEVRLWPATLYGSLERLSEKGWIEELADPEEHPDGESERKRFYRLTPAGREVLVAEASRLQELAETARSRSLVDQRKSS